MLSNLTPADFVAYVVNTVVNSGNFPVVVNTGPGHYDDIDPYSTIKDSDVMQDLNSNTGVNSYNDRKNTFGLCASEKDTYDTIQEVNVTNLWRSDENEVNNSAPTNIKTNHQYVTTCGEAVSYDGEMNGTEEQSLTESMIDKVYNTILQRTDNISICSESALNSDHTERIDIDLTIPKPVYSSRMIESNPQTLTNVGVEQTNKNFTTDFTIPKTVYSSTNEKSGVEDISTGSANKYEQINISVVSGDYMNVNIIEDRESQDLTLSGIPNKPSQTAVGNSRPCHTFI